MRTGRRAGRPAFFFCAATYLSFSQIKTGLANGNLVEVYGNLKPDEQIVTKGSLFIDRAASGS